MNCIKLPVFVLGFCLCMLPACAPKSTFLDSAEPVMAAVAEEDESSEGDGMYTFAVKPTEGEISSPFGVKRKIKTKKPKYHKGIDIRSPRGTAVVATGSGEVMFVGRRNGYGKTVEIQHENGIMTRYAHLDSMAVHKGQKVDSGSCVGTVGRTGRTTGYNLHFEVMIEGEHVDPLHMMDWS